MGVFQEIMNRLFIAVSIFFLLPVWAFAAIAYDNYKNVGTSGNTFTVNTTGSVVIAFYEDASSSDASVAYDGVTMNNLVTIQLGATGFYDHYYWLPNITAGTYALTGQPAGARMVSYSGVDTVNPIEVAGLQSASSGTSLTVNVVASNAWVVAIYNAFTGYSLSTGPVNTDRGFPYADSNGTVSTGNQTQNWTGGTNPGLGLFAIQPPTPTVTVSSILSLVKSFWIF